ncbi:MAG: hypothetical protein WC208_15590 [Gallionella sp.]
MKISASSLKYFWKEKGDIRRLNGLTDDDLKKQFPIIASALERYEIALETLNILIDALPYDDEEEEQCQS